MEVAREAVDAVAAALDAAEARAAATRRAHAILEEAAVIGRGPPREVHRPLRGGLQPSGANGSPPPTRRASRELLRTSAVKAEHDAVRAAITGRPAADRREAANQAAAERVAAEKAPAEKAVHEKAAAKRAAERAVHERMAQKARRGND